MLESLQQIFENIQNGPELFMRVLPVVGIGLVGIFAVTTLIVIMVNLLNKFTAPKE